MKYTINDTEYTKINETSGTIQNASNSAMVELCADNTGTPGIIIGPYDYHHFKAETLYARCYTKSSIAEVRVVPFELGDASGGVSEAELENTQVVMDMQNDIDGKVVLDNDGTTTLSAIKIVLN